MTSAAVEHFPQGMAEQWQDAQRWEREWWLNNPEHHAAEIRKGDVVAGLLAIRDVSDKTVIDIGCGPFSILQRRLAARAVAVDPIHYGYLEEQYRLLGIQRLYEKGENLRPDMAGVFDEAWIYNCLQHVESPEAVLNAAMAVSRCVRIFEWLDIPAYQGHLHTLTADGLVTPFAAAGWRPELTSAGDLDAHGLNGRFFAGVFCKR